MKLLTTRRTTEVTKYSLASLVEDLHVWAGFTLRAMPVDLCMFIT
jgi:hypothetical protein